MLRLGILASVSSTLHRIAAQMSNDEQISRSLQVDAGIVVGQESRR